MSSKGPVEEAAERVLALEEEVESAGDAVTVSDEVAEMRARLHLWVDSVIGVVCSPGVGRVTLIHDSGRQSKIASPDLPFILSSPARFG